MSDSQSRSACTPAIAQLACIIFWQNFNSSFFMSHRAAPFKSQLINAILPYLTHNIVAPALPSCQCHRQMPLHNQRCRDQSSYGLASTVQHFILSSLPLFTQFHSVYNSEILCCQCHLSNTVSHFIIAFLSQIRFHVQNSSTQPHGACHTVGQNQTPQCSFSILLHLYFHPFQL